MRQRPMSPLFITRKFPPSVGGMQTLAAGVWRALERRAPEARIIAHGGSNRELPAWLFHALPRAAGAIARHRVDSVLTGDALTYALCRPLIRAGRLPHATMIMGLDVTYQNRIYRTLVYPALRRAPRIIAISRATAEAAIEIGVHPERISVVRLGIQAPEVGDEERREAAQAVRRTFSIGEDQIIVLTLGRLVRRKGIGWFIRRILPRLPRNVTYVVVGAGPLLNDLQSTVEELGLARRVHTLGSVDDAERERLLRAADLFVQPNIRVPGDMEGFGLVVLEAAMRGTTTVASGIEGILDAVVDGETGILLPPEDETAWVDRLNTLLSAPDRLHALGARFRAAARRLYSEDQMGEQLLELISQQGPTPLAEPES